VFGSEDFFLDRQGLVAMGLGIGVSVLQLQSYGMRTQSVC